MKKALVLGSGGFIGSHLVKRLKSEGYYVTGADLKLPEFSVSEADNFYIADLRNQSECELIFENHKTYGFGVFDEVYQLAADMGGAGYIFSGENDADIMTNSALINLHIAQLCVKYKVGRVFYTSSACIYPAANQTLSTPECPEHSAYPALPDSEYGWEKLFSERLYLSYARNHGLTVRIARLHNIFGIEGTWTGGKEKAPAAMCRKVAASNDSIEVWGDGLQCRSFLYIDECIEGIRRLMNSDCDIPVNIGSEEMISINDLAKMAIEISGKSLSIKNVKSNALGVRGRNSDNKLIQEIIGWQPNYSLKEGMIKTYAWVKEQVVKTGNATTAPQSCAASPQS